MTRRSAVCDDERKHAALARADVLCAPSLGGESFGMVLTEAFAAGTPVVASDIAGYRDVVRDGVDGMLCTARRRHRAGRGAAGPLATSPSAGCRWRAAARQRAERFAWPRVAAEVLEAYEDAQAMPAARGRAAPLRAPATASCPPTASAVRPERLPRLEHRCPPPPRPRRGRRAQASA